MLSPISKTKLARNGIGMNELIDKIDELVEEVNKLSKRIDKLEIKHDTKF